MKKSTKLLSLILSASLASQMISGVNINATKDSITFYDVKNNILDLKAYDAELDTNHDGNMNVFDVIRANKTLIQEESYTDLKEKVYMLETQIESLYQKLNEKTDAEEGKQLSSNDYTDEEKQKLDNLNNYDDSKINEKIDYLVQTAYEEKKKIESTIENKVEKEEGKQLSSNDYTDEEKRKLEGLYNYDDTDLKNEIDEIKSDLSNQFERFPRNEIEPKLIAMTSNPVVENYKVQKPLSLLHFSDIHNQRAVENNLKDFVSQYSEYIDGIICSGDMSGSRFSDYNNIFSTLGFENFMLAIGNHDVYDADGTHKSDYSNRDYWATSNQKYDKFIKPTVSNWGVVQPENAELNGLCYYYKDFDIAEGNSHATKNYVRLIVLDAMAYDSTQHLWLESVLKNANEFNIPVVIAEHFPPTSSSTDTNGFDTAFNSYTDIMDSSYGWRYIGYDDETGINYNAMDLVDSFINDGGEFVCWLCGHLHYARVGTLKSHPNQIYIAVELARVADSYNDMPRKENTKTEDCFNMVSIDTYNKIIKVCRIGAEYDDYMRHRGTMCIDYGKRELIYSE